MDAGAKITGHILAVDDDPSMRQMIADYLSDNELRVTAVASGKDLDAIFERESIDLLLLDLRLPGEDGMQIARNLRERSNVPIIMLTGRRDEADRVMGLELGADDYLTKPFSPRELLARVRAQLRRSRANQPFTDALSKLRGYRFGGWEVNLRVRRLSRPDGENVALTNAEFNLLVAFLTAPQRILTRGQLLDLSRLHNDEVYDRAIDVQVGRLRRKLISNPEGLFTGQDRTRRRVAFYASGRTALLGICAACAQMSIDTFEAVCDILGG